MHCSQFSKRDTNFSLENALVHLLTRSETKQNQKDEEEKETEEEKTEGQTF